MKMGYDLESSRQYYAKYFLKMLSMVLSIYWLINFHEQIFSDSNNTSKCTLPRVLILTRRSEHLELME